jgi:ribonuclease E
MKRPRQRRDRDAHDVQEEAERRQVPRDRAPRAEAPARDRDGGDRRGQADEDIEVATLEGHLHRELSSGEEAPEAELDRHAHRLDRHRPMLRRRGEEPSRSRVRRRDGEERDRRREHQHHPRRHRGEVRQDPGARKERGDREPRGDPAAGDPGEPPALALRVAGAARGAVDAEDDHRGDDDDDAEGAGGDGAGVDHALRTVRTTCHRLGPLFLGLSAGAL